MGNAFVPMVCVDFDGVVHRYDSPWAGADVITDGPVDGAFDALRSYLHDGFTVHLYTARLGPENDAARSTAALRAWFEAHGGLDVFEHPMFALATGKPTALLYIDDRAFHFAGRFPTPREAREFRPWNKGGVRDDGSKRHFERGFACAAAHVAREGSGSLAASMLRTLGADEASLRAAGLDDYDLRALLNYPDTAAVLRGDDA